MPKTALYSMLFSTILLLIPAQAQAQSARDKADARKHIGSFKSTDKKKVAAAAGALMKMGERAIPSLIEALGDSHPKVRSYSAGTLIRIGEKAIPACIEALASKDKNRRGLAVNVLIKIGEKAVPALQEAVKDKDQLRVQAAIYVLKKLGKTPEMPPEKDPAVTPKPSQATALTIEQLLTLLGDADEKKRSAAALDLARKGKPALGPLIKTLKDKNPLKREYAAYSLGYFGKNGHSAIAPLLVLFNDAIPSVRDRAVYAVCMIGVKGLVKEADLKDSAPGTVPAFTKALESKIRFVKFSALIALKLIGPKAKSSVPSLVKMLGDKDGTLRVNAIYAASAIGEAAIPALTGALSSKNNNQRMNAIYALGNLGPKAKEALPSISKYAKDKDAGVRKAVAWARAKINAGATPPSTPGKPTPGTPANPGATSDLVKRLFGRNYGKQKAAEKELRSSDSRQTLPPIIQYICALPKRAQSTQITYITRQLLGMGPRAIPGLVKTLESENKAERDLALRLMSSRKLQPYAAPELQKLLKHEKYGTRVTALEALSRMGAAAKTAIPAMVECLSDKDWRVTRAAVTALGKLEKYSLDEMKKILGSEDNKLRALALEVLMRMRGAGSLTTEHALVLINHDDFALRRAAAKALCWTRPTLKKEQIATFNSNAVLVLAAELRNRVENAASYAAGLLGDLGPKAEAATAGLAKVVVNKKKSAGLRGVAANALADIGVPVESCVPALGEAMLDKDSRLSLCAGRALIAFKEKSYPALPNILKAMRGADSDTRTRAHQAAGAIGVKAVPDLIKGLGDENEKYRFNCAYALGIVGSPALAQVVPECSSKDWKRRETAVCALGEMGKAASGQVKVMIQCLGDSTWQVKKSAGYACGKVGPEASAAVPALRRNLSDKQRDVRQAAAVGLGKIGPASAGAVSQLKEMLADSDEWYYARSAAARALGRIGPKARGAANLLALVVLNGKEHRALRKDAQWALKKIIPKAERDRLLKKK